MFPLLLRFASRSIELNYAARINAIAPIGIFDSGLGGLAIYREVRKLLPAERIIYIADAAHAPYGERDREFVVARAEYLSGFLVESDAKLIAVACNSATSSAIGRLRDRFDVPFVGAEPAVKPAALMTKSGVIGVLATNRTIEDQHLSRLIDRVSGNASVLCQACPGLVECVERGQWRSRETRQLLLRYTEPLVRAGADVIVLGCTHYSHLATTLHDLLGPSVRILDPAPALAREVKNRLLSQKLLAPETQRGTSDFLSTAINTDSNSLFSELTEEHVELECLSNR